MATLKILAVEDSPTQLLKIKLPLLNAGYDLVTANNGFDGYQAAVNTHPDLILLDMVMPGLDGPGMLAMLHDNPEVADIPVVMLTAISEVDAIRKVLSLGVKGYIVKPFSLEVFEEKVKKIFPKINFDMSPKDKIKADVDTRLTGYVEENGVHFFRVIPERFSIGLKVVFSFVRRFLAIGERKFVLDLTSHESLPSQEMMVLVASMASLQKGVECIRFVTSSEELTGQLKGFVETAKVNVLPDRAAARGSF